MYFLVCKDGSEPLLQRGLPSESEGVGFGNFQKIKFKIAGLLDAFLLVLVTYIAITSPLVLPPMKDRVVFWVFRSCSVICSSSLPENVVVSAGLLLQSFPLLFYVHLHYAGYWEIFPFFILPLVYVGFFVIFILFCMLVLSDPGKIITTSNKNTSQAIEVPILNTNRYCNTCRVIKGPKTHHCSSCDMCIDGFDHHCPWLANCIGKSNYSLFMGFVLVTTIVEVLMFAIYLRIFLAWREVSHLTLFILIFTLFTGLRSLFFTLLSVYHLHLTYISKSTIEHMFPHKSEN